MGTEIPAKAAAVATAPNAFTKPGRTIGSALGLTAEGTPGILMIPRRMSSILSGPVPGNRNAGFTRCIIAITPATNGAEALVPEKNGPLSPVPVAFVEDVAGRGGIITPSPGAQVSTEAPKPEKSIAFP